MSSGHAESLLNDSLLNEIFDELEQSALEGAVNAQPSDDEQRRTKLQEVRAIRAVRRKLNALLKGTTNPKPRAVV